MSLLRTVLAVSSIVLMVVGCSATPMAPEQEARAEWVHRLKQEDPERARELGKACYEEIGFDFSNESAQAMAKCMQEKAGAA